MIIEVSIPDELVEKMDRLVEEGKYPSRSALIETAVRRYLQKSPSSSEHEELKRFLWTIFHAVEESDWERLKYVNWDRLEELCEKAGLLDEYTVLKKFVERRDVEKIYWQILHMLFTINPGVKVGIAPEVHKAYRERAEFYGRPEEREYREVIYGWREPWVYDGRISEERIREALKPVKAEWEKSLEEYTKPGRVEWEERLKEYLRGNPGSSNPGGEENRNLEFFRGRVVCPSG